MAQDTVPVTAMEARLVLLQALKERFVECQARNSAFSLRAFSRRLKIQVPVLSEIMRGKRTITRKLAILLCEGLDIDPARKEAIIAIIPTRTVRKSQPSNGAGYLRRAEEDSF